MNRLSINLLLIVLGTSLKQLTPLVFFLMISFGSFLISFNHGLTFNDFAGLEGRNKTEQLNYKIAASADNEQRDRQDKVDVFESTAANRCCSRQKKLLDIGYDLTGTKYYVDVGHCKQFCNSQQRHNRIRHFMSKSPISAKDISAHDRHSCSTKGICEPTKMRLVTHQLLSGLITMEAIEDCHCVKKPGICNRQPRKLLLFSNSPYEIEVDTGTCHGSCQKDLGCRPLKNRTVNVEGPNGAVCVNIIDDCTCANECYRMHYADSIIERIWNDTLNSSFEVTKDIDIGQCVGGCHTGQQQQCVIWDTIDTKQCLMSLTRRKAQCVPSAFRTYIFNTKDDGFKTLLTISDCACK